MSDIGHNSGTVVGERLRSITERIERMLEQRDEINGDIRELYAEAKSAGYDTRVLRVAIRRRRMDAADRQEQDALLEVYENALGQLAQTPLGEAALRGAGKQ